MKKAFLLSISLVLVLSVAFVLANQMEKKSLRPIDEPVIVQQELGDFENLTTIYTDVQRVTSISAYNPNYRAEFPQLSKGELPDNQGNVITDVQETGDACEDPFIIGALPYSDTLDNSTFLDDYGFPGPDVIYELTLTECMDVTISLCATDPIIDTYLYLYLGAECGGESLAEDDDYCTSPAYGTSEIQMTLASGTYYINVDAYGGQTGTYTLDVTGVSAGPAPANDACAGAINLGMTFPVNNVCGTTECATIDCPDVLGWNAVWYKFTLLNASTDVTVDFCPTGALPDPEVAGVGLVLYTSCPSDSTECEDYILADEYEFIECDDASTNPMVRWRRLSGPATYYLPVYTGVPMDFCFDVTATDPCEIVDPAGCIAEGEGECYDGYNDHYNSGCNYEAAPDPTPTVAIADGDTICGSSGTHLDSLGESVRDTDWYRFDLGADLREFRFGAVGEFPMQLLIIKANSEDCADYSIVQSGDSEVCDTLTISYTGTGVYWLWAGPAAGESVNCSFGNYVCWVNITPPLEYDAYVVSVDDPAYHRMAANSTTDVKASVTNLGITAFDFDVDVSISGDVSGEVYTSSGSVTGLTQVDTVQLTFDTFTPSCVENFTMTVTCSGAGEENTENDSRDYAFKNQAFGSDGYHDGSSYWVSSLTGYPTWATRFHVPSGHTAVLTSGEMNFHSFEAPPSEASDITPWICFSDGEGLPDYDNIQWTGSVQTVGPANETHIMTFDLSAVGPYSQDFWVGFDAVIAAGADEQANLRGECEDCIEDAPINNRMLVDGTWRLLDDIWANPSDIAIWCDYDLTAGTYNDGAVVSIDSPAPAYVGAGPHDVLVTVANNGLVAISGATLEIDIGGDFYGIDNAVNIPANSTAQIDFGDWTASVGGQNYIIDVTFTVAGDMDECNNDMVGASYIIAGDQVYYEDFETSDGGYTEVIHSGVTIWQHGEDDSTGAGNDVWGTILNDVYPDAACASLLMPPQVIGPVGGALLVDFWYQIETPGDPWDFGNVKISIDDGETFALLPPFGGYDATDTHGDNLCAEMTMQPGFNGHTDGFVQKAFDLTPYAGETAIFSFDFGSDGFVTEYGMYLDNVERLDYIQSCYEYLPGDVNMYNGAWPAMVIGGDVTYLVNYFRGLPSSQPCPLGGFWASADANGDCLVIGSDVTKLVNYFRGLGDPSNCPDYEPCWPTSDDLPPSAPAGWPNCE
ncbi:MAG: hypothetical protein GY839_10440 [candidate division Zixibacteria bacterium]|nr:hypothetical protein [candidate division Zixibacteria bacterium]